eukprot:53104-Rhodomonas_salina.1
MPAFAPSKSLYNLPPHTNPAPTPKWQSHALRRTAHTAYSPRLHQVTCRTGERGHALVTPWSRAGHVSITRDRRACVHVRAGPAGRTPLVAPYARLSTGGAPHYCYWRSTILTPRAIPAL